MELIAFAIVVSVVILAARGIMDRLARAAPAPRARARRFVPLLDRWAAK